MWIEPFGLFGVCCSFYSISLIPVDAMVGGSEEGES
jgi:hypothetical protein